MCYKYNIACSKASEIPYVRLTYVLLALMMLMEHPTDFCHSRNPKCHNVPDTCASQVEVERGSFMGRVKVCNRALIAFYFPRTRTQRPELRS